MRWTSRCERLRSGFAGQRDQDESHTRLEGGQSGSWSDAESPCILLRNILEARIGPLTKPTLIITRAYSPLGFGLTEGAATLVSGMGTAEPVSCVPTSTTNGVLAHEVGHWSGMGDCSPCENTTSCETMCSFDTRHFPPTASENGSMHSWAQSFFGQYWVNSP
jgi:hypothetical protein